MTATLEQILLAHEISPATLYAGSQSEAGFDELPFFRSFGQASRKVGRRGLELSEAQAGQMKAIYPGFDAETWDLQTVARVWMMHQIPKPQSEAVLGKLFKHSELKELTAIFRGLYTLPNHTLFTEQLAEGVRTNMVDVFEAIAMANPLPHVLLDEIVWTQLVLKAIFMDRSLYRIIGIDERRTRKLALTASDYAHERWSAGRPVCPELWRLYVGFDETTLLTDLVKAAKDTDPLTAQAARLALDETDSDKSRALLSDLPPIDSPHDSWTSLGAAYHDSKDTKDTVQVLYPSKPLPERQS